jgi:hypothetical protein
MKMSHLHTRRRENLKCHISDYVCVQYKTTNYSFDIDK